MTNPAAPRLFVLRHGRSEANELGLIASAVATAGNAYGLTEEGRAQVRASLTEVFGAPTERAGSAGGVGSTGGVGATERVGQVGAGSPTSVISSPLLRAQETAEIAAAFLDAEVRVDDRLLERSFGDLELAGDERYGTVWELDERDPTHRTWGVESVADVLSRLSGLLAELRPGGGVPQRRPIQESVILVTHGDVASTLICALSGAPLSRHREVGAMDTGEIRELDWPAAWESLIFDADS